MHCVRIKVVNEGGRCPRALSLCTSATSVELPNLSAFGIPSAQGDSCGMTVESRGPFASVDAFLAQEAKGEETFTFDAVSVRRGIKLP